MESWIVYGSYGRYQYSCNRYFLGFHFRWLFDCVVVLFNEHYIQDHKFYRVSSWCFPTTVARVIPIKITSIYHKLQVHKLSILRTSTFNEFKKDKKKLVDQLCWVQLFNSAWSNHVWVETVIVSKEKKNKISHRFRKISVFIFKFRTCIAYVYHYNTISLFLKSSCFHTKDTTRIFATV